MILPIAIYGHPVLRKKAVDIDKDYPELDKLIDDMFETMYSSDGVGLAAPQVNKSIRLFIIDASPYAEEEPALKDFKKVFINAQIIERSDEMQSFNEGCLSLPGIREDVKRHLEIRMQYYDKNFEFHDETFKGTPAVIIQHEYDHTDGILFIDRISALRKRLIRNKLKALEYGKISVKYKIIRNKK